MDYESLQLVNYGGEMIPSGYLLGEISAEFSINYLKSLGSPDSAIDKVKDVEVSKILYGVYEILKAAEPESASLFSGYTFTSPEGKQFGAGTENPRVPGNVIHALKDQGRLPKDWSMSAGQEEAKSPEDMKTYLATPVYIYKNKEKEWEYSTTKPKNKSSHVSTIGEIYQLMNDESGKKRLELSQTKVNKKNQARTERVCAMEYDSATGLIKIDVLGNLPNIWANLVTAVGNFDPIQKDTLNATFDTKIKSTSPFTVDVNVIPENIRDKIMDQVLDPDVHFTQIIETLNTLADGVVHTDANAVGNGLSDNLSRAIGLNMSNTLYEMIDPTIFIDMINTGVVPRATIDSIFPMLKQAFDNHTDENGMIDKDMKITQNMLLANIDGSPDTVKAKMEAIMDGMHSVYVGGTSLLKYPKHLIAESSPNFHVFMREVETLFAPVLNIALTETISNSVEILLPLCNEDFPTEKIKKAAVEELVRAIKSQKVKLAQYAHREYKTDGVDFFSLMSGVKLSVEADAALGIILKELSPRVLNPSNEDPIMSKYGAIRISGEFRHIVPNKAGSNTILAFTPRVAPNPSALENRRDSNILAGMLITSISSFGSKARESDWLLGIDHIGKGIEALNSFLDEPMSAADYIPFAKAPPLIHQKGNPARITYVDSSNTIHVHLLSDKTPEESKQFAEMVSKDMSKLLKDYTMDSGRSTACGILSKDPSLAKKMTIEDPPKEYFDAGMVGVQGQISHMLGSFARSLIDPSMGYKRITCLTGGVSSSQELKIAIGEFIDNHGDILQGAISKPPTSLQEEMELKDKIAAVVKKPADAEAIHKVLINSILYQTTMRVLSDPDSVRELIETGTIQTARVKASPFVFGKIQQNLKNFNPADFDFTAHMTDKENAVQKAGIIKDALVHYITSSASAEYERKRLLTIKNPREFGSSRRHSDSFEAISSIGHLIGEINRRDDSVSLSLAPRDPETYTTELTLEFGDGTNFTTGLRRSPDSTTGGAIDMLGTSFQPHTSTMTLDPLELKISQDSEQFAALNATHQVTDTLIRMVKEKNPQRLIVRGTLNSNILYANSSGKGPKRGFMTGLEHDMSITGATEFGADGNVGIGRAK